MNEHDHQIPPEGEPLGMIICQCEHGHSFICIANLVLWLERLPTTEKDEPLREFIVSELTSMALDYSLGQQS